MAQQKMKINLHRTVTTLVCLALLVLLMQGVSWFSQNHQKVQSTQVEELAQTLSRQVTLVSNHLWMTATNTWCVSMPF